MRDTVFTKTAAGLQEIQTRQLRLTPRLRSLLVLVDGKQHADALLETLKPMGVTEEHFKELHQMGLIDSPTGAAPVSAPIAEVAPAQAIDAAVAAADTEHQAADLQMELYRLFGQAVGSLGLRGFKLQLQLEKATSLDDYRAFAGPVANAVRSARGEADADAFLARCNALFGG